MTARELIHLLIVHPAFEIVVMQGDDSAWRISDVSPVLDSKKWIVLLKPWVTPLEPWDSGR